MKIFMIKRVAMNRRGTHGVVIDDPFAKNEAFCVSYELPWNDNEVGKSCIPVSPPEGYRVIVFEHPNRGTVFHIQDVPGRTEVLAHVGNYQDHTEGCVLPGEKYEPVYGQLAVQDSRQAMNEWIKRLGGDREFRLIVKEV